MSAGFSAFRGSLKGKKALALDDEGNARLDEHGKPIYEYKKDIALLYDGAAAMLAYTPQVLMRSPKTGGVSLIADGGLVGAVNGAVKDSTIVTAIKDAVGKTAPFKVIEEKYQYVKEDPFRTTGKM